MTDDDKRDLERKIDEMRRASSDRNAAVTREMSQLEKRLDALLALHQERREEARANDERVDKRLDRAEERLESIDTTTSKIALDITRMMAEKDAADDIEEKTSARIERERIERRAVWEMRFKLIGLALGIPTVITALFHAVEWLKALAANKHH
jgi:chromosome segregation ATPase